LIIVYYDGYYTYNYDKSFIGLCDEIRGDFLWYVATMRKLLQQFYCVLFDGIHDDFSTGMWQPRGSYSFI